jgi:DNA gyrase subunit B/topoisomerase-4 subunit B
MSAGRHAQTRAKLADSGAHGAGCELILVEGDSAQAAVCAVRDERLQAVLPVQGKPLNAWRASAERVDEHTLYCQLAQALGLPRATALPAAGLGALRFERIVLMFDPDADGIHIGALLQLYFARWLPDVVPAGALWLVRAPMFEVVDGDGVVHHALTLPHRDRLLQSLRLKEHMPAPQVRALRGLGGFAPGVLKQLCVDPATRLARAVTPADIADVIAAFGD